MSVIRDGNIYYTEEELLARGWKYQDDSVLTKVYVSNDGKFCAFFCGGAKVAPIIENVQYKND